MLPGAVHLLRWAPLATPPRAQHKKRRKSSCAIKQDPLQGEPQHPSIPCQLVRDKVGIFFFSFCTYSFLVSGAAVQASTVWWGAMLCLPAITLLASSGSVSGSSSSASSAAVLARTAPTAAVVAPAAAVVECTGADTA